MKKNGVELSGRRTIIDGYIKKQKANVAGGTDTVLRMTTGAENSPKWTNFTPGVSERTSGTSKFQHAGIKNADAQSDSSQGISATREYDAFGNVIASTGTFTGRFGYGGPYGYQEDDGGLKQLGHRLYDPVCGRFVTKDPIKDGRNWYAYCDNSPLKRADPSGLGWHDPMIVHVDPGFKGTVIVVGEPGPGKGPVSAVVGPGEQSNPKMDVDYVIIIHEDGSMEILFLQGTGMLTGGDVPENAFIDKNGRVRCPGMIFSSEDNSWLLWGDLFDQGLNNPCPRTALPGPEGSFEKPRKKRPQKAPPITTPGRHGPSWNPKWD